MTQSGAEENRIINELSAAVKDEQTAASVLLVFCSH